MTSSAMTSDQLRALARLLAEMAELAGARPGSGTSIATDGRWLVVSFGERRVGAIDRAWLMETSVQPGQRRLS